MVRQANIIHILEIKIVNHIFDTIVTDTIYLFVKMKAYFDGSIVST